MVVKPASNGYFSYRFCRSGSLDDSDDEIPIYGGIFRGRPTTFEITLVAPSTPGSYETRWGMMQEKSNWFGEELVHTITVTADP